ncbi:arginine--tRNA ligase [Flavobacterium sp.]|uniref:arginine--tRNA ligase n=1 Tax=Flavobacterium sp. TaxID=239 RepID=UPI0026299A65|nr:arginine--tRNA ligase [Flavobacterium sp.]MDD2985811.1 arginine--tRNA ligase [Flavobacterium sp.]
MKLEDYLYQPTQEAIQTLYGISTDKIEFQSTRKDFEGDITLVVFPLLKLIKGNPAEIGNAIGKYLVEKVAEVEKFNVVAGFLNIVMTDAYYLHFFSEIKNNPTFGFCQSTKDSKAIMVEYSSPNTNKPLHLGHIRNNLLGFAVAEILKAAGNNVYKTQIINDRGIHICKSMLAWKKYGNAQTPESTGLKGDKLVGNFYVAFDKQYKSEISELIAKGQTEEEAKKMAPSILEAQQMLLDWEAGKPEVIQLWKTMNQWVYDGFETTYKNLGVDFDSYYYESNTYLLGKEVVQYGLEKGIFEKDSDGSVWIDLTEDGLDRKIVLRSDGTAVYMTQDIGTAIQRVKDFPDVGGMVYTVGNEQDYHFKVLFLILKKLGFEWAENLYHLSYGMVELPSGKMKSREGTVVDADDLMEEMTLTAAKISQELGKLDGYSEEEKEKLYKIIGLGALKYFMLKVDPKKSMLFNPEESVDFAGNTGPFIQYTYARIQSILRKANFEFSESITAITLHPKEKELLKNLALYPTLIQQAATQHSPALVANYTYDLVKEYNSFYQAVPILPESDLNLKKFRVQLSQKVGETIQSAFALLGIEVPERM